MKPEDFKGITSEILSNLSDQGKVSEYLTQLTEHYNTAHTTNETLQEQQQQHEKEINALKETNMNLFLKIQNTTETSPELQQQTQQPEQTLTYDQLVNELGGFK